MGKGQPSLRGRVRAPRYLAAWFLALTLLLVPAWLAAQTAPAAVFGRVTDAAGAPLAGTTVRVLRPNGTLARPAASTDAEGAFRITGIPIGRYRVRVERLGYTPSEQEVSLTAGEARRLDVQLAAQAVTVEEIEVRGRVDTSRERARFETEAGVTTRVISGEDLKILPGFAEADVLRAVEVLPGVVSTSDFSSSFNVRGGSADQNLILLDGFPIFNPFHLGGLFSVFNSDVIARAELFAGGFGAEYGGRVSSVLSVETKPGASEDGRIHGAAGVSLIASRLALNSNLPRPVARVLGGESGSWFLSGRRSYFDQVLKPIADFPYHLTDVQGGLTLGTRGGGWLRFTGYTGRDVLDLSDFTLPGDESQDILRIQWNWGNRVLGVRWEQPFAGWTADTRVGFSEFDEGLGFVDFGDVRFGSRIEQWTLGSGVRRDFGSQLGLKLGAEANRIRYRNFAEAGGTSFFDARDAGTLSAAYGQLQWRPTENWILEPGLRLDGWFAGDTTHALLSPRFAVKRFLGAERNAAVKLALGRYVQFLHSVRDEDLPVSNDRWVAADRYIPPVASDQLQVGIEKFWGDQWYASLEAYGRSFRGVTDLNFADDPNSDADDFLAGTGLSYGADLLVRRSRGKLSGWTTISLLRARRTFPDPLVLGFEGEDSVYTFPPIFDRTLDVDVVLRYELPWKLESGFRWNFGSGIPYTRPVAQYQGWQYDIAAGGRFKRSDRGVGEGAPLYVVLGERNAERYPAYHRLDATLRRPFAPRWGTITPYLQVLNVYNQRNVLFYFYNYSKTPPTRSGISMFPVLPSVGVEVTF
ncbi:TonB-dependent receptor [soil metagenome]